MRTIVFIIVAVFSTNILAQNKIELIDTTKYYAFHINYWFNMHHFLWIEAFMNTKADSTLIKIELANNDKIKLDAALNYYKEGLVNKDLRASGYMTGFKRWITRDDSNLSSIPGEFREHMNILKDFHAIYQKHFWPKHREACGKVLEDNIKLIRQTEEKFVERITKLTRQFWQEPEKVNVDITYFGKSSSRTFRIMPYTTIFPTHVVMNVAGQNEVKGNWLEILYHESAHHLILGNSYFVTGTLKDLAEAENLKLPEQLSHAYLFYFTGQISKELLVEQGIDYAAIYMERVKVFYKYFPLLEKHLMPYINRKITLTEATRRFITDFYN